MKILVTGGAGFIGSNFVYHMLNKYPTYKIICVDALTYAGRTETLQSANQNENFTFIHADISDKEKMDAVFSEHTPDMVVNFAAAF